jgi:hypothetical protein
MVPASQSTYITHSEQSKAKKSFRRAQGPLDIIVVRLNTHAALKNCSHGRKPALADDSLWLFRRRFDTNFACDASISTADAAKVSRVRDAKLGLGRNADWRRSGLNCRLRIKPFALWSWEFLSSVMGAKPFNVDSKAIYTGQKIASLRVLLT